MRKSLFILALLFTCFCSASAQEELFNLSIEQFGSLVNATERLAAEPESQPLQDSVLVAFNILSKTISQDTDIKEAFGEAAIQQVTDIIIDDRVSYRTRKQLITSGLDLLRESAFSDSSESMLFCILFDYYVRMLNTFNEEDQAIEEIQSIINSYEESGVINANRYRVYCTATKSYAYLEDLSGKRKVRSMELQRLRIPLYDSLFQLIDELFGKNSEEWFENTIKKANYYLYIERSMDRTNAVLSDYISQMDVSHISKEEAAKIAWDITESYDTFYDSNSLDILISFIDGIIQHCGLEVEDAPKLYESLAKAKDSIYIRDYAEAATLFQKLVDFYEAIGVPDNALYFMDRKASALSSDSSYQEALSLSLVLEERFLHEAPEIPERQKYWYLSSFANRISTCYYFLNNFNESEKYAKKASAYLRTMIQETEYNSPAEYISDLRDLANSYLSTGLNDYDSYLSTILQLNDFINSSGLSEEEKNYHLSQSYGIMVHIYTAKEDLLSALSAIDNYLSCGGDYLHSLGYKARVYDKIAIEPELALDFYNSYIDGLLESVKNPETAYELIVQEADIHSSFNNIRDVFDRLGSREQILSAYEKELRFITDFYGEDSEEYFSSYLGFLDYKQSLACNEKDYQKALQIADDIARHLDKFGKTEEYYSVLKYDYDFAGDKEKSKYYAELELSALKGEEEYDEKEYRFYRWYCTPEETEKMMKDRMDRWNREGDFLHYFKTVSDLAWFYVSYERREDAFTLFKFFIDNCRFEELEKDRLYAFAELFNLASELNRQPELSPYYEEGSAAIKTYIASELTSFVGKSEKERENLLAEFIKVPLSLGEAYLHDRNPEIRVETVYDNILYRKNALISLSTSAINLIRTAGDTLLIKKYNRLQSLKEGLAKNGDTVYDNVTQSNLPRETAEKLIKRFDGEVTERSRMLGDISLGLGFSWKDVQKHLKEKDIAIEFSRYEVEDKAYYAALLLSPKGAPLFIPLTAESELLDAVRAQKFYQDSSVSDLIWKPLESHLSGKENVYFSPDGLLHGIAIESVPGLASNLHFYRLSSTYKLVETPHEHTGPAIVYGGIRYDVDVSTMALQSTVDGYTRDVSADVFLKDDSDGKRAGAKFLAGSLTEAEDIANQLRDSNIPCYLITGAEATETSFKYLSGQKMNILHVATHGFYTASKNTETSQYDTDENEALYRSGLLFAGANNYLRGREIPHNVDDGILTAKEISELDLRDIDLTVMSACETGLGDITANGVYGLQRGLKKAGAHSLLVSLWAVDDSATQLLMSRFYKNLISGMSKYQSLKEAQQYLKDYTISATTSDKEPGQFQLVQTKQEEQKEGEVVPVHPFEDPFYWAAFILIDGI